MSPRKNVKIVTADTAETSNPEHEKLMEVLKFTPRTYKIQLWGYGGEVVLGEVDRKVWDYFRENRINFGDYAWDSGYGEELNIPEELRPFESGSWHDCDNLYHGWGVSKNAGTMQIFDEQEQVVYERELDSLDGTDVEVCCDEEAWIEMKGKGSVVFYNYSSEKGIFFEGEIFLNAPFDPEKLSISYDDVEGEELVTRVSYDNEDIDNFGGDTSGKGSDPALYLVNEDGETERYVDGSDVDENFDDGTPPMGPSPSDWEKTVKFKGVNPTITGWYSCNYAHGSTFSSLYWNGEKNVWEDYHNGRVVSTYDKVDWWYGYNWDTSNWDNQPTAPSDVICKKCKQDNNSDNMERNDDYDLVCPDCGSTKFDWIEYDPNTVKGRKNREKFCETESITNKLARIKREAGIEE